MKLTQAAVFLSCLGASHAMALPKLEHQAQPWAKREISSTSNSSDPMFQLNADSDFHFEFLRVMSMTAGEGADIGETLIAANQIKPGDFESWYKAFYALATRIHAQAEAIDASKYPVSARNTFFKTASYYRSADFFLHGNWSDERIYTLWDKQLDAFNKALSLMPVPGERIELNSECDNFTIPVIFFPSGRTEPRPTLIVGNGYDGSQEELYHEMGKAALERGINFITYEGPGQPTVRREQSLGFIPEWEKVVTPVVDYALTRPEVDPKALGLAGVSFGGLLAPRAAAFEHRLAAVLAIDGLYSFGDAILEPFPDQVKEVFHAHNKTAFDGYLEYALKSPDLPTVERWGIEQGLWSFNTESPYDWMSQAQRYTLEGLTDKIQAPVFVASAQNDHFFAGQPEILADKLGKNATYHQFKNIDGAGEHCSLGATVLLNQVVLDWFEDVVAQK